MEHTNSSQPPKPESQVAEEFCEQFSAKVDEYLAHNSETIDGQEESDDSDPNSDSTWKFECDGALLSTFIPSRGQQEPSPQHLQPAIGKNSVSSGVTNSKDEVIQEKPSVEFIRENPSYVTPGPNPLRIPHDELVNALGGFTNMFLAHEIAVNEDFRLENFIPKQDSIETRVQLQMKKAFWDVFEESIRATPPSYKHALIILREIKQEILSLLLPHNRTMRQRITESLDVDLIATQIQNDAFDPGDFQRYAEFTIEVLSQLCCPSRDADVNALRGLRCATRIFKGILETIEKMKVDMANFLVMESRPAIIKHCVQYERQKFADFLELEYRLHDDGLKGTRIWLRRHQLEEREPRIVVSRAFAELLVYNTNYPWPETMTLDAARLEEISLQVRRLTIIGTCILSVGSVFQVLFGGRFIPELREKSKKHFKFLLTVDDLKTDEKFNESMFRLAEEACFLVNQFAQKQLQRGIDEKEKGRIRNCVIEVKSAEHKIRTLLLRRVMDYVEEVMLTEFAVPVDIPPGLGVIRHEVSGTVAQFYRIVNHNRRVFGEIYYDIVAGDLPSPQYPEQLSGHWDTRFCNLLKMLRNKYVDGELYERIRNEDIRRVREAQAQSSD